MIFFYTQWNYPSGTYMETKGVQQQTFQSIYVHTPSS